MRRTPGCGTSLKGYAQNQLGCEIVALACELLARTQLIALAGEARRWEPKRLRLRLFSIAGRFVHGGRRLRLRLGTIACGNSMATPAFAGIVALADQMAHHRLGLINPALYAMKANNAPGLVPVTSGNNTVSFTQDGKYYTIVGYKASSGYNLASGNGTVNAAEFVPSLACYASRHGDSYQVGTGRAGSSR